MLSVTNFSPRVALSYQFEDGALLYASYTEGFRSGGFNGRSTNAYDHGPYDPEEVSSIEVGYKTVLLDQRMSLNVAAFFTTYDDKQEEVVFPALGGAGTVTIVENVEEAQINGLEVEMSFIATEGLTLNASFGYLDASFEDYQIPFLSGSCTVFDPCTQVGVIDKSHFELRRAPETNFNIGALYEVEMGAGNFLIGKINYRWRDEYHTTTNNAAEGFVKSFGMLDASIHFEFGDSWRLSLYGKNLTDEDYLLHALDPGTSFVPASTLPAGVAPSGYTGNQAVRVYPGTWSFGTVNPPRNFGLEVQYSF